MITDASNAERDQINAMAQERRAAPASLAHTGSSCPASPTACARAMR